MKKLKQLVIIYRTVQLLLLGLLIFMAIHFQQLFQSKGTPGVFVNSILASLVIQLLLFYPVRKFASAEAAREASSAAPNLTADEQKSLRQKRIFADILKAAVFIFFVIFILLAPPATFVMSTTFFCFVLLALTYCQCFTFALSRIVKGAD